MEVKERESAENKMLNPQITDVYIGTRDLRKITLYPLSIKDQMSLSDVITSAIQTFVSTNAADDKEMIAGIIVLITQNMGKVLSLVTGLPEEECGKMYEEMTNLQASDIVEKIYEINYGCIAKNVVGLLEKINQLSPSGRQLPTFAKDTTSTDLKISTESPSETVE